VDRAIGLFSVSVPPGITLLWKRPDQSIACNINSGQINQIVMNLCINAIHAMPAGGTLTVTLSPDGDIDADPIGGIRRPSSAVRLVVADTGVGMSDDVKSHIFEPMFTTKAPGHGTGLGLSVVSRIVNEHGGKIQVESTVGKGTAFHIFLPLDDSSVSHSGVLHQPLQSESA
jgi:signal transduction histidine kinase